MKNQSSRSRIALFAVALVTAACARQPSRSRAAGSAPDQEPARPSPAVVAPATSTPSASTSTTQADPPPPACPPASAPVTPTGRVVDATVELRPAPEALRFMGAVQIHVSNVRPNVLYVGGSFITARLGDQPVLHMMGIPGKPTDFSGFLERPPCPFDRLYVGMNHPSVATSFVVPP